MDKELKVLKNKGNNQNKYLMMILKEHLYQINWRKGLMLKSQSFYQ